MIEEKRPFHSISLRPESVMSSKPATGKSARKKIDIISNKNCNAQTNSKPGLNPVISIQNPSHVGPTISATSTPHDLLSKLKHPFTSIKSNSRFPKSQLLILPPESKKDLSTPVIHFIRQLRSNISPVPHNYSSRPSPANYHSNNIYLCTSPQKASKITSSNNITQSNLLNNSSSNINFCNGNNELSTLSYLPPPSYPYISLPTTSITDTVRIVSNKPSFTFDATLKKDCNEANKQPKQDSTYYPIRGDLCQFTHSVLLSSQSRPASHSSEIATVVRKKNITNMFDTDTVLSLAGSDVRDEDLQDAKPVLEESTVIRREVLNNFRRVTQRQAVNANCSLSCAREKKIGVLVSLSQIPLHCIEEISRELLLHKMDISQPLWLILYETFIDCNTFVLVKEPYSFTLGKYILKYRDIYQLCGINEIAAELINIVNYAIETLRKKKFVLRRNVKIGDFVLVLHQWKLHTLSMFTNKSQQQIQFNSHLLIQEILKNV